MDEPVAETETIPGSILLMRHDTVARISASGSEISTNTLMPWQKIVFFEDVLLSLRFPKGPINNKWSYLYVVRHR